MRRVSADPSATDARLPTDNAALMRFGIFQSEKPDAPTGGIAKSLPAPPTGHLSVWLEEITLPPAVATASP